MEVRAHAKINLSLRILGKREDGYHELETLMTEISLHDTLRLERLPNESPWKLTCSRPELETADNLVANALRAIEAEVAVPLPVAVHLEKRIPSGAGLGGGSSDAAATLRGVTKLFNLEIGTGRLLEIAATLGSDVPFFLFGRPCLCTGRGDAPRPVPLRTGHDFVLFKLPFDIPTPWAYRQWSSSKEAAEFAYREQKLPWVTLVNDLERPVYAKYLILGQLKNWLLQQEEVVAALLTGSGSALFAVLHEAEQAPALLARARERYGEQLWAEPAKTLATSEC